MINVLNDQLIRKFLEKFELEFTMARAKFITISKISKILKAVIIVIPIYDHINHNCVKNSTKSLYIINLFLFDVSI